MTTSLFINATTLDTIRIECVGEARAVTCNGRQWVDYRDTAIAAQPEPSGTSGNTGFDHFAATRFVLRDVSVSLLPDPLGGQFSVSMTPEQAEHLVARILSLAKEARRARADKYPLLYPEDIHTCAEGAT